MSKLPKCHIKLGQVIKKDRLVWQPPHNDSYTIPGKNNDQPILVTRSSYHYLNDDGVECELYFSVPENFCYGVGLNYGDLPQGVVKGTEDSKKYISGAQVALQMTSTKTVAKPTKDEAAFMKNMDIVHESAVEHGYAEADNEETILPTTVTGAFAQAKRLKKPELALRKFYSHPKDPKGPKDKEGKPTREDKTKPPRMYVDLMTKGKGLLMKVETPFYLPGNVKKNPLGYINKWGNITPIIVLRGMNFAGKKIAANVKFDMYEANYVVVETSKHTERLIEANTAEPTGHEETEDDDFNLADADIGEKSVADEEGEDEGFAPPSSNPVDLLNAAGDDEDVEEEEDEDAEALAAAKKAAVTKAAAAKKALLEKKRAATKTKAK